MLADCLRFKTYDVYPVEQPDHWIDHIVFKPLHGEVYTVWMLMMVVLETFTNEENIPCKGVFRMIVQIEVAVAIFVSTPVYEGTVYWANQELNRK